MRDGKWVRTRVTATVDKALRHTSPLPWSDQPGRLTLEFDNGEIELNGVIVKAGRYPIFVEGESYLGLLAYDSFEKVWRLGRGFRIVDNRLARLGNWDGSIDWHNGSLDGVPVAMVIERLAK